MDNLEKLATLIRYYILLCTTKAGSGHPSTSLSAADLMAVLFFKYLHFDLDNPDNPNNDRVVFSKGHASPLFYALYTAAGAVSAKELETMRQFDSVLEGHPTPRFKYTEAATGSLGQGLSVGVGMSLALRKIFNFQFSIFNESSISNDQTNLKQKNPRRSTLDAIPSVYVLLGDGEMAEGSVWEAIQIAAHYKLSNLVGILDVNRLAQSDATIYGHDVDAYAKRISAFGWNTVVIDGHDLKAIDTAFKSVQRQASSVQGMPTMIIAKTLKGKGVLLIEDKDNWHGKALKEEEFQVAIKELGEIDFKLKGVIQEPAKLNTESRIMNNESGNEKKDIHNSAFSIHDSMYKRGDKVATRQAYGEVLTKFGEVYKNVVALDADVKNSTYSELFKKAFPDRFFDMYIAEQNMVGAASGFARLGFVPFASTFAAFLTRAYDQIRMAALSQANIKLVGSHAGVSIGEDGPSQMALEDFAMFRAVHGSVVLHPADAVATEKLVEEMITHRGMVYMRTARPATPVIYDADEEFVIGGSKVHRVSNTESRIMNNESGTDKKKSIHNSALSIRNSIVIIATGVTLHEALAASEQLKNDGLAVTVIDCYSIKPVDQKTIVQEVTGAQAVIVVEDHWVEGGLGDAVLDALAAPASSVKRQAFSKKPNFNKMTDFRMPPVYKLAVRQMPRSGKPAELMDWAGISQSAIIKKVREIIAQ